MRLPLQGESGPGSSSIIAAMVVRRRRLVVRVFAWSGLACLLAAAASCRWNLFYSPSNGLVWSIVAGRIGWFTWDTGHFRIEYERGVTLENSRWGIRPWPYIHWNSPSVDRGPGVGQYVIALPLWMPALALLGSWHVLRRRGWHLDEWQCRRCGYDRRGISIGLPCPECGAAAPTSKTALSREVSIVEPFSGREAGERSP